MEQVDIFETSTRDGEQAGHKFDPDGKVYWAHLLADAGVNIIEAGFPISSPGDAYSVEKVAREVSGITVCALARTLRGDIDAAWKVLRYARRPRIHTFIATSKVHIEDKLRKSPEEVIAMAVEAIEYARTLCDEVEFSPEDSARTSREYLVQVVRAAVNAGATVINVPDTVGIAMPWQYEDLIRFLHHEIPDLSRVTVSTHCHNDLGNAAMNSIAGVRGGARQIEGCFLGIGERAGNAALEQAIMALTVHREELGVQHSVDTTHLGPLCRGLSRLVGYPIPEHAAVAGRRAFAHSSGIHRNGVLKNKETYEIMSPESVGWEGESVALVSHLGRSGLSDYLTRLGYDGAGLVEEVYPPFQALADLKKQLTEEDLHMIVQEILVKRTIAEQGLFSLDESMLSYGPGRGRVRIWKDGVSHEGVGKGDGAIDALFMAVRESLAKHGVNLEELELVDYNVVKGVGGPEAIGWVVVSVKRGEDLGFARSGDVDVVKATVKAYLYAINHLLVMPAQAIS